jgi:hypothetical protein
MFSKLAAEASSYITGKPEVASKDRFSTMLARSLLLGNLPVMIAEIAL